MHHDLNGFHGDAGFLKSEAPKRMFSGWRESTADLYAWRAAHVAGSTAKSYWLREADFAFRQAFALDPANLDTVRRYLGFLKDEQRTAAALIVAGTASHVIPRTPQQQALIRQLKH